MKIESFNLSIVETGGSTFVKVESSLVGETELVLIDVQSLSNLGHQPARILGTEIYQAVFLGTIGDLFRQALQIAERENSILRTLIKYPQRAYFHAVPWETLYDGKRFICLNPNTPIIRYLEQVQYVKSLNIEPPLRVLFTTACPQDVRELDLDSEEKHIRTALRESGKSIQLVVENHISVDRLRQVLSRAEFRGYPFHIWHHCGHGEINNDSFRLILEKKTQSQSVDVSRLSDLLSSLPMLKLALLNVCHGGSSRGLVPALAELNVPAVIGFRDSIFDRSALLFAEVFYSNLFENPIGVALGRARQALRMQYEQNLDWMLPILFLRSRDYFLLKSEETEDTTPTQHINPLEILLRIRSITKDTPAQYINSENLRKELNIGKTEMHTVILRLTEGGFLDANWVGDRAMLSITASGLDILGK